MPEVDERLGKVEERLDSVEKAVDGLRSDVQKLRVLEEANAQEIRLLQEGHGARFDTIDQRFDRIDKALEPLAALDDFVRRVASDHENRITELETRADVRK